MTDHGQLGGATYCFEEEIIRKGVELLVSGGYPLLLDPLIYLRVDAAKESAEFIKENMSEAVLFRSQYPPDRFWRYSLNLVKIPGLYLEFGVASGTSINFFAKESPGQTFHGFDSFEGLPEDWTGWVAEKGRFSQSSLPAVAANVELHKGWFEQTLPEFLEDHTEPVAFLHIDCDIYSSTKCVFSLLARQIKPGTVIVFDEFMNYPGWKTHEYKALKEFTQISNAEFTFKAFYDQKAAIIVDKIDA